MLQIVPQIIFWLKMLQLSILNHKDYVNNVIKTVENVIKNKTIVSHVIYIQRKKELQYYLKISIFILIKKVYAYKIVLEITINKLLVMVNKIYLIVQADVQIFQNQNGKVIKVVYNNVMKSNIKLRQIENV